MEKLVKEVGFGKATARITVTKELVEKFTDGQKYAEKMEAKSLVEIVAPNGKVVTNGLIATNIGERVIVGKAETQGIEVAENINNTIEEMKKEILEEKEENNNGKVEAAKEIIESAEKQGIENLMTNAEYKAWAKGYNDLVNEGGEGYIPERITKEQYDWAVGIVK